MLDYELVSTVIFTCNGSQLYLSSPQKPRNYHGLDLLPVLFEWVWSSAIKSTVPSIHIQIIIVLI